MIYKKTKQKVIACKMFCTDRFKWMKTSDDRWNIIKYRFNFINPTPIARFFREISSRISICKIIDEA